MALTVVLVRHGQAAAARPSQTDMTRHLTPTGAKALAASYPRVLSMLDTGPASHVVIWESPAVRAHETSAEIQRVIGERDVEVCDFLYEQDQAAFVEALLAHAKKHKNGTVICVGHIPFMEDMATYLCGSSLAFAPGAMAAIRMDRTSKRTFGKALPGTLLWFAQGPKA